MLCPYCRNELDGKSRKCGGCSGMVPVVFSGGGSNFRGMNSQMGGFICYLGFFITGIIFYLLEKEDRYIRFHALQSIVTFSSIALLLLFIRLPFGGARVLDIMYTLVLLAGLVLWVMLMLKAYQGDEFELPLVGEWVKERIRK